jgi:hypothetical protein
MAADESGGGGEGRGKEKSSMRYMLRLQHFVLLGTFWY